MGIRFLPGMCLAAMFCVASFGAAITAHKDAPLADAVERGDRRAILSLLKDHDNPDVAKLTLALDPETMLLVKQ